MTDVREKRLAVAIDASVAHVLVERGELTDHMRLVDGWPEFGAHGKDLVTLRHVLTHTAGVPGLPPDTGAADLCDWDRICGVVADAARPLRRLHQRASTS